MAFSSQPFWLLWSQDGKTRRHVPDFFARLADGTGLVIDVRADDQIAAEDAEVFAATRIACEHIGWGYRRVGAVDPVLAANVRWLSGYRHARYLRTDYADRLLEVARRPTRLRRAVEVVWAAPRFPDS